MNMKRIVLTRGLGAGAILGAMTAIMVPLCVNGTIGFDKSELVGYSAMVIAFLLVFFGIRSYREEVGGGAISFGKAFQVGILVTLVACAVYVLCWEIVYWGFIPDFAEQYNAHALAKLQRSGATEAAIRAAQEQMVTFARLYKNPLFNIGITFLEVFPVGLIVTLISAAILRRRQPPARPSAAAA